MRYGSQFARQYSICLSKCVLLAFLALWIGPHSHSSVLRQARSQRRSSMKSTELSAAMASAQSEPSFLGGWRDFDGLVTGIAPSRPPSTGSMITILGIAFGKEDSSPRVWVGGTTCDGTKWFSHSSIVCQLQPGQGANVEIRMSVPMVTIPQPQGSAQSIASAVPVQFAEPVVSSIVPSATAPSGGARVTLFGSNFGQGNGLKTVQIGNSICMQTIWTADSSVICRTPAGSYESLSSSLPMVMSVASLVESPFNRMQFGYLAPIIARVFPLVHSTVGGSVATIQGLNFGISRGGHILSMDGVDCQETVFISDSSLHCIVPPASFARSGVSMQLYQSHRRSNTVRNLQYSLLAAVSSISPMNSPPHRPPRITIFGGNIDPSTVGFAIDGSPTTSLQVEIGMFDENRLCGAARFISMSAISCEMPSGTGNNMNIRFILPRVAGQTGDLRRSETSPIAQFSFDSPFITSIIAREPQSGASSPSVTIFGYNFGGFSTAQSARVGETASSATQWVSRTCIVLKTPAGQGGSLPITVTIVNQQGSLTYGFSYARPVMFGTRPRLIPNLPSVVQIYGAGFGLASPRVGDDFALALGNTFCSPLIWISSTVLNCTFSGGAGHTIPLRLNVQGLQAELSSSSSNFPSFLPPKVSNVSPTSLPTAGGDITIFGSGFGTPSDSRTIYTGSSLATSFNFISDSSISAVISPGTSGNQDSALSVHISRQSFNVSKTLFSYDIPLVSSVSPNSLTRRGYLVISVYGTGFGPSAMEGGHSLMIGSDSFHGLWNSDSSMTSLVPSGNFESSMSALPVNVTVGSLTSIRGVFIAPYAQSSASVAAIQQISPAVSSPHLPAFVQIIGAGLGFSSSDLHVSVGATECITITWRSTSSITCLVSPGTGAHHAVIVRVTSSSSTSTDHPFARFCYLSPVLTSILPASVKQDGSAIITLNGDNFSDGKSPTIVSVGKSQCRELSFFSTTSLTCKMPASNVNSFPVTVTVDGQSSLQVIGNQVPAHHVRKKHTNSENADRILLSSPSPILESDAMQITHVKPRVGTSLGGTFATFLGSGFGSVAGRSTKAYVSSQICLDSQWFSDSSLVCKTPAQLLSANSEVAVEIEGTDATIRSSGAVPNLFNYQLLPIVLSVFPPYATTTGGALLTITGRRLGTSASSVVSVKLGITSCLSHTWLSSQIITCNAAAGTGTALPTVVLQDSTSQAAGGALFSYSSPVVSSLKPSLAPTSGGISMTIFGSHFGIFDSTVSAFVGSSPAAAISFSSDSSITMRCPPGVGTLPLVVMVSGFSSVASGTGYLSVQRNFPEIHSIYPSVISPTSSRFTLTGRNFPPSLHDSAAAQVEIQNDGSLSWQLASISDTQLSFSISPAFQTQFVTLILHVGEHDITMRNILQLQSSKLASFEKTPPEAFHVLTTTRSSFLKFINFRENLWVGSTPCVETVLASEESIACILPPSGGIQNPVGLSIEQQAPSFFLQDAVVRDPPKIYDVNPSTIHTSAIGSSITVTGSSFGQAPPPLFSFRLSVNGSHCDVTAWQTDNHIVCMIGPSFVANISIALGNQESLAVILDLTLEYRQFTTGGNDNTWFQAQRFSSLPVEVVRQEIHYSPEIDSFSPAWMRSIGGDRTITVLGKRFGLISDASSRVQTAFIGASECTTLVYTSDSSISCQVAHGFGASLPIRLLNSQTLNSTILADTTSKFFSYASPLLSSIDTLPAALSAKEESEGRMQIAVTGTNLHSNDDFFVGARHCLTFLPSDSSSESVYIPVYLRASAYNFSMSTMDGQKATLYIGSGPAAFPPIIVEFDFNNHTVRSALITNSIVISPVSQVGPASAKPPVSNWEVGGSIVNSIMTSQQLANNVPGFTAHVWSPLLEPSNGQTTDSELQSLDHILQQAITGSDRSFQSKVKLEAALRRRSLLMRPHIAITADNLPEGTPNQGMCVQYVGPSVTSLLPNTAPATGGTILSIFGTSLGHSGTPTVFNPVIGQTACETLEFVSTTSLKCKIAPGVGGPLTVSLSRLVSETCQTICKTSTRQSSTHIIATVDQSQWASLRESISMSNFFGKQVPEFPSADESNSELSKRIKFSLGQISHITLPDAFSYAVPVIQVLSRTFSSVAGNVVVTMTGLSFGTVPPNISVSFGLTFCQSVTWNSDSSIVALVPAASAAEVAVPIQVTVQERTSPVLRTFEYTPSPSVTAGRPQQIPTTGGATIMVFGTSFGPTSTVSVVKIGLSDCISSTWVSPTAISCTSPPGIGIGVPTRVLVAGQTSQFLSHAFTYEPPMLTSVSPGNGPGTGSFILTIAGNAFGTDSAYQHAIRIAQTGISEIEWFSDSSLTCKVSAGTNVNHHISVDVGQQTVSLPNAISFDGPFITGLTPQVVPAKSGQFFTVLGLNFGFQTSRVSFGSNGKTCTSVTWTSESSVACIPPAGVGVEIPLSVTVDSQSYTKDPMFGYSGPEIASVTPNIGDTGGGQRLTLEGVHFGSLRESQLRKVFVGITEASNLEWVSDSYLEVTTRAGTGLSLPVIINVQQQVSQPSSRTIHNYIFQSSSSSDVSAPVSTIAGDRGRQDVMFSPTGVAVVSKRGTNQYLFAAERGSHRIFRVGISDPNFPFSIISGSILGEPGTSDGSGDLARFRFPTGLVLDESSKTLYVCDTGSHRIRSVTFDGHTETFLGSTSSGLVNGQALESRFRSPQAIAIWQTQENSVDNLALVIADTGNNAIRLFRNQVVSTVSGQSTAGNRDGLLEQALFYSPMGIACSASLRQIFVADTGNHRIRLIKFNDHTLSSGTVETLTGIRSAGWEDGPAHLARFHSPVGLALSFANSGTLFVADSLNHRIRAVSAQGYVSTIAGSGAQGSLDAAGIFASFDVPSGLAIDETGVMYVSDQKIGRIRRISPGSTCGDGRVTLGEQCDDANLANFDGCSSLCTVEQGWMCVNGTFSSMSSCSSICGDGSVHGSEECDDGNDDENDGCSNCRIEFGWNCDENTCNTICGDGFRKGNEECDDGNNQGFDGCTAQCQIQALWVCQPGENGVGPDSCKISPLFLGLFIPACVLLLAGGIYIAIVKSKKPQEPHSLRVKIADADMNMMSQTQGFMNSGSESDTDSTYSFDSQDSSFSESSHSWTKKKMVKESDSSTHPAHFHAPLEAPGRHQPLPPIRQSPNIPVAASRQRRKVPANASRPSVHASQPRPPTARLPASHRVRRAFVPKGKLSEPKHV